MKKFFINTTIFFLPILLYFILSIMTFILIDPFMIIGNNRGKIKLNSQYNITWNRDFQTTELFLKNYSTKKYNSFILGNSRSFFYRCNTWDKFINGNCYHFNASAESLFGIESKIRFLKKKNVNIDNLLIILDHGTLSEINNTNGHIFIKHPEISNESWLTFYKTMFSAFTPRYHISLIDLIFTGKRKNYMINYGITDNVWKHNTETNELTYFLYDSIINDNKINYYNSKKEIFYNRDTIQLYYNPVIYEKQKELLENIYIILKQKKTNYKIIINPLYDQKCINKQDLKYLEELFGRENVYDFSGINKFTNDYQNYYETSHYRTNVADSILEVLYENN